MQGKKQALRCQWWGQDAPLPWAPSTKPSLLGTASESVCPKWYLHENTLRWLNILMLYSEHKMPTFHLKKGTEKSKNGRVFKKILCHIFKMHRISWLLITRVWEIKTVQTRLTENTKTRHKNPIKYSHKSHFLTFCVSTSFEHATHPPQQSSEAAPCPTARPGTPSPLLKARQDLPSGVGASEPPRLPFLDHICYFPLSVTTKAYENTQLWQKTVWY